MMAATYWRRTFGFYTGSEFLESYSVQIRISRTDHNRQDEILDWLASDVASGIYDHRVALPVDGISAHTYTFSHERTAFAFKLRFG